jgi:Sulfotransferase domain
VDDGLLGEMLELVKGDAELTQLAYTIAENRVPMLNAMTSPRTIKSHMPFSLLPPSLLKTAKVKIFTFDQIKHVLNKMFYFPRQCMLHATPKT